MRDILGLVIHFVSGFSSIAALFSSIAALGSIYYLHKTLKEMKIQRKMTYMPQIIIEPCKYYVNSSNKTKEYFIQESETKIGKNQDTQEFIPIWRFINIGYGAAIDLNVKLIYNSEEFTNKIIESAKIIDTLDISVDNKDEFKYLIIKSNSFDEAYNETSTTKKLPLSIESIIFNEVLPITQSNYSYKFEMPEEFCVLIKLAITEAISKRIDINDIEWPDIKLQLSYKDFLNEDYSQTYQMEFSNYDTESVNDKYTKIKGEIKYKKVSE